MTEAFSRSTAREATIWEPFLYSFPFDATQTANRTIIYGLYANAYLNQNKYLNEVESEDLANLLADYNAKIADLTNQEQIVVAEIVSRRYLANIEDLVFKKKMATKQAGIEADDDIWDSKMAALATDTAALETMAEKVASETEKTAAKITEIQAYIEIEGINLTQVDIDIAEKAIQSSKVDIQKLDAANDILRIQINTVETAHKLIDVDREIARTKIDIAETDRNINKIGLLDSELTIEQGRTSVAEAETSVAATRVVLAEAKTQETENEITYYRDTLTSQAHDIYDSKIDLMDTRSKGLSDGLTMRKNERDLNIDNRLAVSALETTFANDDKTLQALVDAANISVMNTKVSNTWVRIQGAIEAAKTAAAANIVSTLTHTIKKA
jgi:hypothetical protein